MCWEAGSVFKFSTESLSPSFRASLMLVLRASIQTLSQEKVPFDQWLPNSTGWLTACSVWSPLVRMMIFVEIIETKLWCTSIKQKLGSSTPQLPRIRKGRSGLLSCSYRLPCPCGAADSPCRCNVKPKAKRQRGSSCRDDGSLTARLCELGTSESMASLWLYR